MPLKINTKFPLSAVPYLDWEEVARAKGTNGKMGHDESNFVTWIVGDRGSEISSPVGFVVDGRKFERQHEVQQ